MFFDNVTISDLKDDQGISLNDDAESAVASASEGQEGGVLEGITNFILAGWDVVKMVAGFLLILTPFPILAFFSSLALPTWIILVIGAPIVLGYVLAIAEFVRGSSF